MQLTFGALARVPGTVSSFALAGYGNESCPETFASMIPAQPEGIWMHEYLCLVIKTRHRDNTPVRYRDETTRILEDIYSTFTYNVQSHWSKCQGKYFLDTLLVKIPE
jgi:hypothetical protein